MGDAVSRFVEHLSPALELRGDHVVLEPMQLAHCEPLSQAASDGELWKLPFTTVPSPATMRDSVISAIAQRDAGEELPFVVRRLSDQRVVGSTRYYFLSAENRNLSIGYTWYSRSAQRTVVNTESKYLLLRHAFENLSCVAVHWHTHHANKKSQAAIERLGAKLDGVVRNHKIMPDGTLRNTFCYSMIDTEWPESKIFLEAQLSRAQSA